MVAVRAFLLCCNLVSGMCSRARRRQQQRFGTAIARGSRLRCRHLQSRRTDNIISTNSRVVHPDNLPNCRGPIRLHNGGDGGRSCRPRFHQIGRLTVIDRLGVEVDRPAARDRIIAGGARNPRSSMHQTLPRKAPVGSFPCVLVAVLWVFVPPPPVAADSDDPIPGNCCGCALESRAVGWVGSASTGVGAGFACSVIPLWRMSGQGKGSRNGALVDGLLSAVASVTGVSAGSHGVTTCCCGV